MDQEQNIGNVEIWGGAEYSVVRVANTVYDQLHSSGHEERPEDLNYFHQLGIKKVRYPLLWEKYYGKEKEFFNLHDVRLENLRSKEISPIAGLLHHGSGPFTTSLYHKDFPELLADYALRIARRYPWLDLYTPVNEPLTTARFSGLYGLWYPHHKNDRSFARIFFNELKGIVLAMQAVKSVNPSARLVQTEDICRVFSTGSLQYQAYFENVRRWLTYDLLMGRVNKDHPLRNFFLGLGIAETELDFFITNPEEPGICGFNYYVTSDRFLDDRKNIYPACFHGGNTIQEYADVEAVRANIPYASGSYSLLREAWERYKLPIALTEVHLACTREEQMRWFYEAWITGNRLRSEGVDFKALTAWSFFGSFDWSSLLCEKRNDYEPGIFDIRSGSPRPTALADLIKTLNNGKKPESQLLKVPGWWRRNDRLIYKPDDEPMIAAHVSKEDYEDVRPILIIGATGSLGQAFARICKTRGIAYHISGREELDIASEFSVRRTIELIKPWAIINAAGFTRIDDAEKAAYTCFRENTIGPVILAEACRSEKLKFVTFSADQVFNGEKKKPYKEDDSTNPLNTYGLSKKLAEEKILKIYHETLIIRSSFFFNPWHSRDSLGALINNSSDGTRKYMLPTDIIISPTYIPSLVNMVLDLMIDNESGIWHLSNMAEISLYDFVHKALSMAGLGDSKITPVSASRLNYAAQRPSYSVLKPSSGLLLPDLETALSGFINEMQRERSYQAVNQSSIYTEFI